MKYFRNYQEEQQFQAWLEDRRIRWVVWKRGGNPDDVRMADCYREFYDGVSLEKQVRRECRSQGIDDSGSVKCDF